MFDALKFVLAVAVVTASSIAGARAQPFTLESRQLRESLVVPPPAAYHLRTRQVLMGVGGDVRRMEETATGRLLDRGILHADPGNTVLRVRVDARRDRLWVLDIGRVHVIDLATNRRIRTVALPNWMFSAHADMCLPDLALDEHGAAFVSDNMQPKLWRIDPADFSIRERVVSRDAFRDLDVGFTALAIGEGGVMFAAMAAPGLLWRRDTGVFRAEHVPLASRLLGVCGLEAARAARSRGFTLYALQVRDRFTVSRVTMARGSNVAAVVPLPTASTLPRSGLIVSNGSVYLAVHERAGARGGRRETRSADLALMPIHREE
jgi:hypothetical protein